jgi:hypothetical protein
MNKFDLEYFVCERIDQHFREKFRNTNMHTMGALVNAFVEIAPNYD